MKEKAETPTLWRDGRGNRWSGRKGIIMKYLRYIALLALLTLPVAYSQAGVVVGVGVGGIGVGVGVAPVCAYGYYPDAPYGCAPYGYYGPSWFSGGVFIGAGPWYHGWGHPVYPGRPFAGGFYGRGYEGRGYAGRGFVGHGGPVGRVGHGFVARGAVGGSRGGFHGGGGSRGGR
jgi:hypothetical protein